MGRTDKTDISEAINSIKAALYKAENIFYKTNLGYHNREDEIEDIGLVRSYIEGSFIKTLILLEVNNLLRAYDKVNQMYIRAQASDFAESEMGIEDPYLVWSGKLRSYLNAIEIGYNINTETNIVAKDVISILRSSLYSITDKKVFPKPPANEKEVHARIEAVLRCVFPDLKHKPHLTKPIKNYEPDTGLPLVRTLIEYKFISNENEAKIISDQLLADTRGFNSKDWDTLLYVIYETHRIKPESKWNQHFKECGVDSNAKVIVLSGEPT